MTTVMKISPQGQIRIPKKIMQTLKILPGDYVEVDVENGNAVLRPRKLIDPAQSWYWTPEWQSGEAAVDADLEKNAVSPKFKTAEDGLKWLNK